MVYIPAAGSGGMRSGPFYKLTPLSGSRAGRELSWISQRELAASAWKSFGPCCRSKFKYHRREVGGVQVLIRSGECVAQMAGELGALAIFD